MNSRIGRLAISFAAVLLFTMVLVALSSAGSLRNASPPRGSDITAGGPGEVLWGYYETTEPAFLCPGPDPDGCNHGGNGDNIIRLVNPNGSANPENGGDHSVCAMIYVFDDDQEMGECCGCPLTSAELETFSVENLTSNWAVTVEASEETTPAARSPSSPLRRIRLLLVRATTDTSAPPAKARRAILVAIRPTFPVTALRAPATCSAALRTIRSFRPDRPILTARLLSLPKSNCMTTRVAT